MTREEHTLRRSLLLKLHLHMKISPFSHDLTREIQRLHARRRSKRQLAWLCLILFSATVGLALGYLAELVHRPLFTGLLSLVVIGGFWSINHLATRH